MAEQTNGATPPYVHTAETKARLSVIAKKNRKEKPHSTRRVPEAVIAKMGKLADQGVAPLQIAKQLGVGFSTTQRYLREIRPKRAKKQVSRLTPAQHKLIETLLGADSPMRVEEIARRAKCHVSSVYTHRERMKKATEVDTSAGIPARSYRDLKHANDKTWENVRNEEREPTDGEMLWTLAWRGMNRPSQS